MAVALFPLELDEPLDRRMIDVYAHTPAGCPTYNAKLTEGTVLRVSPAAEQPDPPKSWADTPLAPRTILTRDRRP